MPLNGRCYFKTASTKRERVRGRSKSATKPSNHLVVTFSCFHACLFAINFYKPFSRILTKLLLTVSVQFSMFLLEDEIMEWPPPPYCRHHHFFNVYVFIFDCAESSQPCSLVSGCGEPGPLSSCAVQASFCRGFSRRGPQAQGRTGPVAADPEL